MTGLTDKHKAYIDALYKDGLEVNKVYDVYGEQMYSVDGKTLVKLEPAVINLNNMQVGLRREYVLSILLNLMERFSIKSNDKIQNVIDNSATLGNLIENIYELFNTYNDGDEDVLFDEDSDLTDFLYNPYLSELFLTEVAHLHCNMKFTRIYHEESDEFMFKAVVGDSTYQITTYQPKKVIEFMKQYLVDLDDPNHTKVDYVWLK